MSEHTPESIHAMCIHTCKIKNIIYDHKFTLEELKQVLSYDTEGIGPHYIKHCQPHLDIEDIKKIC
jgi:hypothetical protein